MMPYSISKVSLIIDDIIYPVTNLHDIEIQEKVFGLNLYNVINIKGLGSLEVTTVSILNDNDMIKRFEYERQFKKYNIRCKVTDRMEDTWHDECMVD